MPTFSVIPVVGDGKWIWKEPPRETGYLEPREFELRTRILLEAERRARDLVATTVIPVEFPEQQVIESEWFTEGCEARVVKLTPTVAQLQLTATQVASGQNLWVEGRQKIRVCKNHQGFVAEQFPKEQAIPAEISTTYLRSSPGIEIHLPALKNVIRDLTSRGQLPWSRAAAFHHWVWENIEAKVGDYTSVDAAMRKRVGDCEERAAVFIALCRASGIPARLVWVPNHAWAEFYLVDRQGTGHWIPAHTAAYSWFGWTGVHELTLQKGDRIPVVHSPRPVRLVADWYRYTGGPVRATFSAQWRPLGEDRLAAGPGTRVKAQQGIWQVENHHPDDRLMRQ